MGDSNKIDGGIILDSAAFTPFVQERIGSMRKGAFSRLRSRRFSARLLTGALGQSSGSGGGGGDQERQQMDMKNGAASGGGGLDMEDNLDADQPAADEGKVRTAIKRILPHVLLLAAASLYTVGGGYAFYMMERNHRPQQHQVQPSSHDISGPIDVPLIEPDPSLLYPSEYPSTVDTLPNPFSPPPTMEPTTSSTLGPPPTIATDQSTSSSTADPSILRQRRNLAECTPALKYALVEQSKRECVVLANDTRSPETHIRYCSTLLRRLGECLKAEAGGHLPPLSDPLPTSPTAGSTTTTSPTTTTTTRGTTRSHHRRGDFESKVRDGEWTPSTCTFMAFTIISTIGYGDVAPVTTWGRLFCIVYGLFGIPLALLAVADQGRFLTEFVLFLYKKSKSFLGKCLCRARRSKRRNNLQSSDQSDQMLDQQQQQQQQQENDDEESMEQPDEDEAMPALLLLGLFALYLFMGGFMFTKYEPHWSYVDAVYFIFVSSATIGFGDILPSNQVWLPFTLLYIALGLALATAAIDICAEYLRRLHHFGTKLRNCANKFIWFGGKRLTIGELVKVVGTNLGVAEDKIQDLVENFDQIVEHTIIEKEALVNNPPPAPPPPPQPVITMPPIRVPTPDASESTLPPQETFSVQIPFIDSPCSTSDKDTSLKASLRTNTVV